MTHNGQRRRIGMLTPSSNTVLEPMASVILRDLPDVSVHCSRLPVMEISLADESLQQFNQEARLAAAGLLAHAKVHVIGWNGTSASWSGFEADVRLCDAIRDAFGVEATTAVLAINELLEVLEVKRLALVTPYVADVQNQIIDIYRAAGFECASEYHSGERINYAFADVGDDELINAIRSVASAKPDAIVIMCTNLRAAHLVDGLEAELGIPILDSVAAFVWKAALLCGIDTRRISGWGQLFNVMGKTPVLRDVKNA